MDKEARSSGPEPVNSSDKVLIVGPSWVGDMVMAHALFQSVYSNFFPPPEIHVVAPPWSKPVLARMPEVSHVIELPAEHGKLAFTTRLQLGRRLRPESYTQAIILPRSLKSALVPFFARVPIRTGFLGECRFGLLNDIRPFDKGVLDQTVKRFFALGVGIDDKGHEPIPRPRLKVSNENLERLKKKFGLNGEIAVALMPGAAFGPAKQWPLKYYADLASRLAAAGVNVWVLGSNKERALGIELTRLANHGRVRNFCGKTSLGDAIDLLGAAVVAVGNDSGLMHVAAAVDTHIVAIYGSTLPSFAPPLTDAKDIFFLGVGCSPCFQRHCPLGHFRCLRDISVGSVCSAVITALGNVGYKAS